MYARENNLVPTDCNSQQARISETCPQEVEQTQEVKRPHRTTLNAKNKKQKDKRQINGRLMGINVKVDL